MKRKIVVIVGSQKDLNQCGGGLILLQTAQNRANVSVHVKSVHRHTKKLHWLLGSLAEESSAVEIVIIAGAGKAAHLPGCADAYLRYHLRNPLINVIGVAFEGNTKDDNLAARLSITQVPGTQARYAGFGSNGFMTACKMALNDPLTKIHLPDIPQDLDLTLAQALELTGAQ